jgi:hypothetical protein
MSTRVSKVVGDVAAAVIHTLDDAVDRNTLRVRVMELSLQPEETICFISHCRDDAASDARLLHDGLCSALEQKDFMVFIDASALTDLGKIVEHVNKTRVLVLLQTKNVLFRPFVLAEIYSAMNSGSYVLPIVLAGKGYKFEEAAEFLMASNFPERLEKASPGSCATLEEKGIDVAEMGSYIGTRLPNIISVEFNVAAPDTVRLAVIQHIGKTHAPQHTQIHVNTNPAHPHTHSYPQRIAF